MKPEKLVTMANQIGAFFASQKGDEAIHGIADHFKKFWDPRMRAALLAHFEAGGGVWMRCAPCGRKALPRKERSSKRLVQASRGLPSVGRGIRLNRPCEGRGQKRVFRGPDKRQ